MQIHPILILLLCFFYLACSESNGLGEDPNIPGANEPETPETDTAFIRGADLSYVNEMLDCGGIFYNSSNEEQDPYQIFATAGTNLVRVRLWHNPDWTNYSNFDDVKLAISRAQAQNMQVLLDFHYSDDWADPAKQKVPAAWLPVVNNLSVLSDSVYNYTTQVLESLQQENLLPEFVQVGNETNIEILQDPDQTYDQINWTRNAALIKRGIQAVRDIAEKYNTNIKVMLHVAQPENALWWFEEAKASGVHDYDWIGISYYPKWSSYTLDNLPNAINTLVKTYDKALMVVETAYPFTLNNADPANNILGNDALIEGYPATPEGQYNYLVALEQQIRAGGGRGLVYWEPAWISTSCSTQWGQGSHWDNATLFDQENKAHKGMEYYKGL